MFRPTWWKSIISILGGFFIVPEIFAFITTFLNVEIYRVIGVTSIILTYVIWSLVEKPSVEKKKRK